MSGLRLVVLLVMCGCLAMFVRGQGDPSTACQAAQPVADGPWETDVGYWDLSGFQSFYSSTFQVLCAFRGLYQQGPAGSNTPQFGPWHGNPNDTNCDGPNLSQYKTNDERGNPSSGNSASRRNSATGGTVLTSFNVVGVCDTSANNAICAGNCLGFPNYDANLAALRSDDSYKVTAFDSAGTSDTDPQRYIVVTTLNSTQRVSGPVAQSYPPYKTATMSAITTIQKCYGPEQVLCPTQ